MKSDNMILFFSRGTSPSLPFTNNTEPKVEETMSILMPMVGNFSGPQIQAKNLLIKEVMFLGEN